MPTLTQSLSGTTSGNEEGFGTTFKLRPSAKPVEILVGSVTRVNDPRTNRPRLVAGDQSRPVKMTEYGEFEPSRRVKPPAAYILKPDQRKAVDLLLAHGVAVERIKKAEAFEVEQYLVKSVVRAQRAFQGHIGKRKLQSQTKRPAWNSPKGHTLYR